MEYNTVSLFKALSPRYVLGFASHYIVDFILLSWVHFCLWGGACEWGTEVLAGYLPWSFYTLLFGNLPLNLKLTYLVRVAGQQASRNSLSLPASTLWAGVTASPRRVGLLSVCRGSDVKPSCLPGFTCCGISPTPPMYIRFKVFILFYFVYSPVPSRSSLTGTAVFDWIISISPSVEHELRAKQPGFPLKTIWRARHWAWKKGEQVFPVHMGVQKVAYSGTGSLSAMERTVRTSSARMFSGQLFLGITDPQRAKSPHLRQGRTFPLQIGQHSGAQFASWTQF